VILLKSFTHLVLENLGQIAFVLAIIAPAIASIVGKKIRSSSPGTGTPDPVAPADLEERVRRSFEELLRQRGRPADGASPPPPKASAPAATLAAPPVRSAPRPPPPPPPRPAAPPPVPVARMASAPRAPTPPADAYHHETDVHEITDVYHLPLDAYHLQDRERLPGAGELLEKAHLDRAALRRAVVLKEILDRPVTLQEPRVF